MQKQSRSLDRNKWTVSAYERYDQAERVWPDYLANFSNYRNGNYLKNALVKKLGRAIYPLVLLCIVLLIVTLIFIYNLTWYLCKKRCWWQVTGVAQNMNDISRWLRKIDRKLERSRSILYNAKPTSFRTEFPAYRLTVLLSLFLGQISGHIQFLITTWTNIL